MSSCPAVFLTTGRFARQKDNKRVLAASSAFPLLCGYSSTVNCFLYISLACRSQSQKSDTSQQLPVREVKAAAHLLRAVHKHTKELTCFPPQLREGFMIVCLVFFNEAQICQRRPELQEVHKCSPCLSAVRSLSLQCRSCQSPGTTSCPLLPIFQICQPQFPASSGCGRYPPEASSAHAAAGSLHLFISVPARVSCKCSYTNCIMELDPLSIL